eukprot:Rhum_TRINITY_DN22849_c0_g1::Rhum_TRINITY_DN22849_c0_g1_i1::g.176232::m.176232
MALRTAALLGLVALTAAQAPIPTNPKQLGWKLGNQTTPESAGVTVELWGDFQCPDTRDSWNNVIVPLLKWVEAGSLPVTVYYRPFPLPYHHNTYRAALSAVAATDILATRGENTRASAFESVASQLLSAKQDKFQNAATANLTDPQIYSEVLWPIVQSAGLLASDKAAFLAAATARSNDLDLRVSWKYGTSRAVTGTPVFALSSVISNSLADYDLAAWKAAIQARL